MDSTHGGDWPDTAQSHLIEDLDADATHAVHRLVANTESRTVPANIPAEHRVAWVRISDLISSGTGRMAGRGIDFEAELARRLRHPVEFTRRAINDRRSSLPPVSAFGLRQPSAEHESISRR
jgi:hypothetical protein